MKALEINRGTILHKLATMGGMSDSGYRVDKVARKHNDLLRSLMCTGAISYQEFDERQKKERRPVDFCEFTRHVLLGALLAVFVGTVFAAAAGLVVSGTYGLIFWAFHWISSGIMAEMSVFAVLGSIEWSACLFVLLVMFIRGQLAMYQVRKDNRVVNESDRAAKAKRIQEKLRKREIRAAFWGAIRNKTCFKLTIK